MTIDTNIPDERASIRVGRLGELEVELQLVKNGWHPVRLDTAQMASNADLLAIDKQHRTAIQVKTTDATKQGRSQWLGFGYSTAYKRDAKSIFNSKESPLIADVVIGVSYSTRTPTRFVVMPVAFAEALCRYRCDYWSETPTRTETRTRSHSYPIYLCFTAKPKTHSEHHERIKRNLMAYEARWDILVQPTATLHNREAWPLLD
jgi:hypothetical protein